MQEWTECLIKLAVKGPERLNGCMFRYHRTVRYCSRWRIVCNCVSLRYNCRSQCSLTSATSTRGLCGPRMWSRAISRTTLRTVSAGTMPPPLPKSWAAISFLRCRPGTFSAILRKRASPEGMLSRLTEILFQESCGLRRRKNDDPRSDYAQNDRFVAPPYLA